MLTGFDHVIVLVSQLEEAMDAFRRLGFTVRAGGEHPAFGSQNALVPLSDASYLELLAFRDPALATQTFWSGAVRQLTVRPGFGGFVIASDNLADDAKVIRGRSLDISDPQPGARRRPDGTLVSWFTSLIGGTPSGPLPFLIQDDTPRHLRIEPAGEGLGRRVRIQEIVVAVNNIEKARQAYRELLDVEPRHVQNTAGDLLGYRVPTGWGSIILAHPERGHNAMSDQLAQRGEGVYALTLAVDDVNWARTDLTRRGVALEDDSSGFLIVPQAACGARIRLAMG